MITNSFTKADRDSLLSETQQDNLWLMDAEFTENMQKKRLRQEIFTAIERLETNKIQLIDSQFKRILNRYSQN